MHKRSNHNAFSVGDTVRIITASGEPGDTLYTVASKNAVGFGCTIRPSGTAPNGKQYAAQQWDTSMLLLDPSDERLARAFARALNGQGQP